MAKGYQGQILGLVWANSYHWVVFFFAIVSFVWVVFPLDHKLPQTKLTALTKQAGLKTIINLEANGDERGLGAVVIAGRKIITVCRQRQITTAATVAINQQSRNREQLAVLLATSGTTGQSKIVKLTAANLLATVPWIGQQIAHSHDDIFYNFLPYCHVYGLHAGLILPLFHGAVAVVSEYQKNFLTEVQAIKPTIFLGVPLIFELLYERISRHWFYRWYLRLANCLPLSPIKPFGQRLRFCFSGGAVLSPTISRFFIKQKLLILNAYGMSETASTCALNLPTKHQIEAAGVIPLGENVIIREGEILVKGENVTNGYHRRPDLTKQAFTDDGYFKTGDLGYLKNGFLFVTGRKDARVALANGKKIVI